MNVRFGMSEMMVVFATALLWHSVIGGCCVFAFAAVSAFCRWAVEYSEKAKKVEASRDAMQTLNEQAGELGEALSALFAGGNQKKNTNLH
jgi:predicted MFS family arabinose efflux permease